MDKYQDQTSYAKSVRELVEQRRLTELDQLVKSSKQLIPETAIRLGYQKYLSLDLSFKARFFLLLKLKEITAINPGDELLLELSRSVIQEQPLPILVLLKDKFNISVPLFKRLNKDIQAMYRSFMTNNQFIQVSLLQELTEISPGEELVQTFYLYYLMNGKFISFKGLLKETNIAIKTENVQTIYMLFRKNMSSKVPYNGHSPENYQKWYKKLTQVTGIADEGED